jgi:hypothetical protein
MRSQKQTVREKSVVEFAETSHRGNGASTRATIAGQDGRP